ncbi:hypothetical protein FACS189451_00960 [Bacteroidia bacterium]|nr:hypothetical protein FACS189446_2880 [Bacteroidia bacterium]GHT60605.1 hypothetical protein FACS189451_00960 [Bacteroidia bacterium]
MKNRNHIFVDTNILIGAYSGHEIDRNCLQYLFSLTGKRLFISSLSIAQFVSVFQKSRVNADIKQAVNYYIGKFNVIDFSLKDISHALTFDIADVEDSIQYVISSKFSCFYFVTNNIKDYTKFMDLDVVNSLKIRKIRKI